MNTFEKYINKKENQDLKNFTKYLDTYELAMLEMHFLSFAKEQLRIHDVVGRSEQLFCPEHEPKVRYDWQKGNCLTCAKKLEAK